MLMMGVDVNLWLNIFFILVIFLNVLADLYQNLKYTFDGYIVRTMTLTLNYLINYDFQGAKQSSCLENCIFHSFSA